MLFGSLFAGIGGIDLGLERAGMQCAWQVEFDDYCQQVLKKHWPDVPMYGDIREIESLSYVDLICGGFPCPAFSIAGKRGGFKQDDLFFELLRIVDNVQPTYIILENVTNILRWRKQIEAEIKSRGYEYIQFILDARDFGLAQARKRWFMVCVPKQMRSSSRRLQITRRKAENISGIQSDFSYCLGGWTSTGVSDVRWLEIYDNTERRRIAYGIPNRVDRLNGLGNAVVPQVAEWIGRRIMEYSSVASYDSPEKASCQ